MGKNQTEARIAYHEIEKGKKPGFYKEGGKHATPHIQEIDADNFVETVLRDDAVWVVEYYSDKCPICNSLAPEITKAAEKAQAEHPGKLKFGAINSRVWDELAGPFGSRRTRGSPLFTRERRSSTWPAWAAGSPFTTGEKRRSRSTTARRATRTPSSPRSRTRTTTRR